MDTREFMRFACLDETYQINSIVHLLEIGDMNFGLHLIVDKCC